MSEKTYSITYRLIHWAIAISLLLILVTIFLRLTWMNKDHVAAIIQNYLSTTGQSLTQEQLAALAKQIRQPMWVWHTYIGYVLAGLFSIRLLLPIFGEMKFRNPFKKELTIKEKFQDWIYLIFTVCTVISLTTGLILALGPKDLNKTLKEAMSEIHVLSIYYLVPFIAIHWGGVILAEFTSQQGIISGIVSGVKKD